MEKFFLMLLGHYIAQHACLTDEYNEYCHPYIPQGNITRCFKKHITDTDLNKSGHKIGP